MVAASESLPSGLPAAAARAFVLKGAFWSVALFCLLRLSWFDRYLVGALVEFQRTLVFWYGSDPNAPIVVNSSCSGADVMALCAAVTLAYPVAWRRRITGALIGLGVILLVNTIRIATLYAVASAPATLQFLHVYVWPIILSVVAVLFVVLWIRRAEGRLASQAGSWRRFGVCAAGFLLLYVASIPWVFTSAIVARAGVWTAAVGGFILSAVSPAVHAQGNVLVTGRGAFQVTQECLFTPMLPLYFAAVFALPASRRRRSTWIVVALPLFFALGVARLLVLALPPLIVESPAMLAHGFYQLLAAGVAIIVAAHVSERRNSGRQASRRTVIALTTALAAGVLAANLWTPALDYAAGLLRLVVTTQIPALRTAGDEQGALALLPGFQIGLFAGLWVALARRGRHRALVTGIGVLCVSQLMFLAGVGAMTDVLSVEPHALVIRAWAFAFPLALAVGLATPGATLAGDRSYLRFWHHVGTEFPSLSGAPSTAYYFENEKRLISEAVPALAGRTVLKTDLWDEAKNTRIMQWAADQGARVFGVDLSEPIVRQAAAAFEGRTLRPAISDVRRLPFGDASFDVIYSMGTIEHFAETEAAVVELARVLKPGGRLILGVPNRHDPFLRPLMVWVLYQVGLYDYGYEKCYSRRRLRSMLRQAGLDVTLESSVLFIPGLLRMADLWCFTRAPQLTAITRALIRPFEWLDAHVPAVRRHGYLLASVGVKPANHSVDGPQGRVDDNPPPAGFTWELSTTSSPPVAAVDLGVEYVVDARGCDPDRLRSLPHLQRVFSTIMEELQLRDVAPPAWHVFPGEGGLTGMVLLSESHLTVHTYPEAGVAAFNLYCCRRSVQWNWEDEMRRLLAAQEVTVRSFRRG
jgi:S-adenosylmethionine decarboxylase